MDFVGAIKAGFKNYAVFRGTATLPEYWYWVLFTTLVGLVTSAVDQSGNISLAISLATMLPSLSVLVRRLRDAGFSWLWLLLPVPALVPFGLGLYQFFQELIRLGYSQFFQELIRLGYSTSTFTNPDQIDEATLQSLMTNEVLIGAALLIFGSLIYLFVSSLLVNLIFPTRKTKSFEQGNKRVAPITPENPTI
jgi:uncharacterized membrane protein YhaH (DUF805 family)